MTIQQLPQATCHRCGCPIKYVFEFDGKPYGSTCVEVVSGVRPDAWQWVEGKPNYEATQKSLADKEAERLEFIHNNTVLEEERRIVRKTNQVKFEELINVLNNASKYPGDFCSNMAENIGRDGSTNDLYKILGHNPYNIIREIWGKQTGGRMNSKKYNVAVDEFDQKFDEDV